jgi:ribosomal protein S18 acetylase RimI-like enzyme
MPLTDEDLRDAASHRGLKLVKSRKRKPGVGDYGLFGLTDASGKPLFGVGDGALTATAEQIADFLRKGEVSTWARSAEITPARPRREPPLGPAPPDKEAEEPPAILPRRRAPAQASDDRPEGRSAKSEAADAARTEAPIRKTQSARQRAPTPEPQLAVRTARPADAGALDALLSSLGIDLGTAEVKRRLVASIARKEPILVADRGKVVGCLVWHIVPTLDRGAVARISMIAVHLDERRRGVGRALYNAAVAEFGRRKARSVEAMSDIELRNANGFYRAVGLKQVSYRFAVDL